MSQSAKANPLLRRETICCKDTFTQDLLAKLLGFDSNFFQMNGCGRDYAVHDMTRPVFFARARTNKVASFARGNGSARVDGRTWLRAA
jgi:hypothetical protein